MLYYTTTINIIYASTRRHYDSWAGWRWVNFIPYTLLSGSVRDNVLDAIRWQISWVVIVLLNIFSYIDEYCERWLEAAVASVWALS